ncbi:hypothetical protein [Bdellovibrio sp. NC01]|uniref:hypothetical protein n=1 Tax=Bdellovibrio sp. NC01 TaxID=2220073 RepID=UPI001157060B|nr:hypothetical protein [Bdellovibrio sp. NC01]QDK39356.1 hypothetical protein DOE51_18015 [Bdellovibrio sp. NC01]
MNNLRALAALCFLFLFVCEAKAYPDFIAYGYSSCLTCHYNGNGGGPLNDYGRALWSAEIASRAFYPKSMTDEQIAAQSGFFGSLQTPLWLRPHIKYRGLNDWVNPGGSNAESTWLQMQAEAGLTVQVDEEGKYLATATWGHVVDPAKYGQGTEGLDRFMATEYYIRVEAVKTWWLYVGMMEKVFGIRNINHTSYQRTYQGFNVQNDTSDGNAYSQGIILQKIEDKWDASLNYFFGNPYDQSTFKQKGISLSGEFEIAEKKRLGASFMTEKSDVLEKNLLAIFYRQGLSKGSSLMLEGGLIKDKPDGGDDAVGSYEMLQTLVELTRGYNIEASVEHYNKEFKSTSPDNWKWMVGLLAFPLPRLELRFDLVNERQLSSQSSQDDTWQIQGQVHVSL